MMGDNSGALREGDCDDSSEAILWDIIMTKADRSYSGLRYASGEKSSRDEYIISRTTATSYVLLALC
mgnify:CR=1 FL=1